MRPEIRPWRSPAVGDRSARVPSAGARAAGPGGRTATMRSHIERMSELENGRFVDDALKRAGRSAAQPVDMTRFREFAEVVRFFRIEAESRLPGASRPKGTDVTDSGQAATAGRIYRAILDEAARRYREAPRGRGACRCPPRLRRPPRRATRGMVHPLGASPDPRRPEPCLTVQRGPVARRADGVVGGRPIVPRRPRASRPPRRWGRRACASPRIRRRRTVLPSGSPVGAGAGQVAMKRKRGDILLNEVECRPFFDCI